MSLHFTITLDPMAGSSFKQCGDDALRIATQLNVRVVYTWSGIKCHVYQNGSTANLLQRFEQAVRSKEKNPWVSNYCLGNP
jgi:hypothetical protein